MMMHIGLFPAAVAWNLSTNKITLQDSRRIRVRALIKEPTTQASKTKKSWIRWVAETTSEVLVDDKRVVKQAQPIAKPDPRDYQVALAQAKAGLEQAKAQLAQSQAQLIQADAQAQPSFLQLNRRPFAKTNLGLRSGCLAS